MKTIEKYHFDVEAICNIKGSLFIYIINKENKIIACNALKKEFFKDLFNCENIIGSNPLDYLKDKNLSSACDCYRENPEIIKLGQLRQCYHAWFVKGLYRLDLLTLKMPLYDQAGQSQGLLITSQFLNKISLQAAYERDFQNAKRSVYCIYWKEIRRKKSRKQ